MGGSVGKSESDSDTSASSAQNVYGTQDPALGQMYGAQGNLFQTSDAQTQGLIPGAITEQQGIFGDANSAWNDQLGGGAYAGMDLAGNYNRDRMGGGNEQFINESIMGGPGNNYVDAMKGQLQQDSDERLGSSLAMNDARAAGNDLSGSSRHGLTESRLYDDANKDLSRQQTGMGFNTFDKDLDRKLGIAQRADQFDMGRLQQSGNMLQDFNNQQGGAINQGGALQNFGMGQFAPSMAPWQAAGQYASGIGNPTVLGSGSGSGSSDSKGKSGSGGVGGGIQ